MRAYRNVNLNIPGGMISLPVSICAAYDKAPEEKPTVVGPEGEALKYVYVREDTREEVDRTQTKRQFGDKVVSQDDLKAIDARVKIENLDIIEVCPKSAVDYTAAQGKFFVYSHKKNGNPKALNLFVQALRARDGVALVKWTPSSRQQLLALSVDSEQRLIATQLPFGAQVKGTDEEVVAHVEHEPSAEELDLADKLLDMVAGDGSALTEQADDALELRRTLINEGVEAVEATEEAPKDTGADLMDALKASVDAVGS